MKSCGTNLLSLQRLTTDLKQVTDSDFTFPPGGKEQLQIGAWRCGSHKVHVGLSVGSQSDEYLLHTWFLPLKHIQAVHKAQHTHT